MHRLNNKQIQCIEEAYEDGKTDRDSLYTAVRDNKISKAQVSEFLRHRKLHKIKEIGDSFEKPKNNKSRVVERVQDDEDENNEQQESKESK